MRLDKLTLKNFRGFAERSFEFQPQFNLIIGENGTGKTSVLKGAEVAVGILDFERVKTKRDIAAEDARRTAISMGESLTFEPQNPVEVTATGTLFESAQPLEWNRHAWVGGERSKSQPQTISVFLDSCEMPMEMLAGVRARVQNGERVELPLIACYAADRLWSEPSEPVEPNPDEKLHLSRFEGYRDCFHSSSSKRELNRWIFKQDIKALKGNGAGIAYGVMKSAILGCLPHSKDVVMDYDLTQAAIVFEDGKTVLLDDLSDGQRTMVTLVGDLARRAITLNPWMGAEVLQQTHGVVLIDELDLHLHPQWQRRLVDDLRRTFPKLQFICTTHSPFLIQSVRPGELIKLDGELVIEPTGRSLEEIVDLIMDVSSPERSQRHQEMLDTARDYLGLVEEAKAATPERQAEIQREVVRLLARFTDNPAYTALLERKGIITQP